MKKYIHHMMTSAMLFAGAGAAGAVGLPAPGAVTPQTVKVPDGPGSVRGLANDAQVSSFTGQVSYEIPIALPAGQVGFGPKLALSYSGALGNGPLGLGWSFGQVSVRRSLRLGVPSYTNADELELVGLPGGTLVSIGNGQYRAEGQGNSIRGVAVDGGFELVDATGTRYRLGTSDASRLASGVLVAGWYLERVTDVAGHVIDYSYERRGGELYLTAITWGGDNAFRAELPAHGLDTQALLTIRYDCQLAPDLSTISAPESPSRSSIRTDAMPTAGALPSTTSGPNVPPRLRR